MGPRRAYGPAYRKLRRALVRMYGQQCQVCSKAGRVQAHHIHGDEDAWENLILLCASCHTTVGNEQKRGQPGPMHAAIAAAMEARDG